MVITMQALLPLVSAMPVDVGQQNVAYRLPERTIEYGVQNEKDWEPRMEIRNEDEIIPTPTPAASLARRDHVKPVTIVSTVYVPSPTSTSNLSDESVQHETETTGNANASSISPSGAATSASVNNDHDTLQADIIAVIVVASAIGFMSLIALLMCAYRRFSKKGRRLNKARKAQAAATNAPPTPTPTAPPEPKPLTPEPKPQPSMSDLSGVTLNGHASRPPADPENADDDDPQRIHVHISVAESSDPTEPDQKNAPYPEIPRSPRINSLNVVRPKLSRRESSRNWEEEDGLWEDGGPWISSRNSVFGSEYSLDGDVSPVGSARGRHSFCPEKGVYEIPCVEEEAKEKGRPRSLSPFSI
ncbi:hypothetical protein RUND412_002865 [Rhizina undulata]